MDPKEYEQAFQFEKRSATQAGLDEDDEDERKGKRKIKIEYIQDKSRRHITFSKRKAGIMKKAYELSTLTGTQVLLLVASETGHVYTFATPKLQPLITKPEGKNLIQQCLNAPDSIKNNMNFQPSPAQSPVPSRPMSAMSTIPYPDMGSPQTHRSTPVPNDTEFGMHYPVYNPAGLPISPQMIYHAQVKQHQYDRVAYESNVYTEKRYSSPFEGNPNSSYSDRNYTDTNTYDPPTYDPPIYKPGTFQDGLMYSNPPMMDLQPNRTQTPSNTD
jgi:hypothetical protein